MAWAPPPPPTTPPPPGGTVEWARWHIKHSVTPETAAVIEWLATMTWRTERLCEYVKACHALGWAGWLATLAWNMIEALAAPIDKDEDIPF